ncbi:kinase-like domain-containing protein [Cubamyces menziesii]|nr:kinase-like domain-containing protein [Cubamyces menziesii]
MARGIILNRQPDPDGRPQDRPWHSTPYATPGPAALPYAYCRPIGNTQRRATWMGRKLAVARNAAGQDVVLKVLDTDSDEYQAYYRMLASTEVHAPTSCCGVLRPVAIIHTPYKFCFVVMPRWGRILRLSDLSTVDQAMQFMRCTSKGLSFLHDHRIVHRDLHESNMLVNYYSPDARYGVEESKAAAEHRRTGDVHYCLIDFNISFSPPLETALETYTRPAYDAYWGAPVYQPADICLGEHAYSPFAFDVACLGNIYRTSFHSLISHVPELAPLFDKMTTHQIPQRFTAREAADFIEHVFAALSGTTLGTPITAAPHYDWYSPGEADKYWSHAPPEFTARWSQYRTPERSWVAKILARIAEVPVGWRILYRTRDLLRI